MEFETVEVKEESYAEEYEITIEGTYVVKSDDSTMEMKSEGLPEIKQEEIEEEFLEADLQTILQPGTYSIITIQPSSLQQDEENQTLEYANVSHIETASLEIDSNKYKRQKRNGMVKCTICKAKFFSENTLELHLKSHRADRLYECEKCDEMFRTLGELMQHQKTLKHFRPTDTFEEKVRMLNKKRYKCSECNVVFYSERTCRLHSRAHSTNFKYDCGTCKAKFSSLSELLLHKEKLQHGLKCKDCGTVCVTNEEFEHHQKMHSKTKVFKCGDCGFSSIIQKNLNIHKSQCHIKRDSNTNSNVVNIVSPIISVTCIACKKTFDDTDVYLKHHCAVGEGDAIENIMAETETIDSTELVESEGFITVQESEEMYEVSS